MRVVTELPRRVRVLEHAWIPLPDGCRLSARVWLPEGAAEAPVPAVLEYIPYRKNDATALRDARMHGYFAGHGYAAVRVDLRGSGDSDGILRDEYLPLEQRDALEVLRWLASRPWCSGSVGIIGKSWGGFNALQIAALSPPELSAVISVASTDDRYADDVHYMGGCLLASDMLAWGSTMLAYNARPPDPAVVGQGWRKAWLERMEDTPPFVEAWLGHQRRGAYWKHGSVCEDYGAISCPVYMVGGWADGYRSAILRFLAGYAGPCKALIGPWGHVYPHDGAPGPPIGFLQEAVRWWDRWLRDVPNGIMDEPALRVWMQEPARPARRYDERPGRWIAEPSWPSATVEQRRLALGERELGRAPGSSAALAIRGSQITGADSGPWCGWGGPSDFPGDQRGDDGRSLTFDSAPLDERIEVLGFPQLRATLVADRPRALVAVRLCDVWPDGASTLITSGLLNLTHAAGHERPRPLEPGRPQEVAVTLRAIAYALDVGHRLRLAISPTLWPWAWPSPEPVTLTVHVDDRARLELPVRASGAKEDPPPPHFSCPEIAPTPAYEALGRAGGGGRTIRHDVARGATEIVNDIAYFPPVRLTGSRLEYVERARDVYRIVEDDPLSAWTSSEREIEIARGEWRTRVETVSTLSATTDTFLLTNALSAYEGERRVLARTWHRAIRRDHV